MLVLLAFPTDAQTTQNYGASVFFGTVRREDTRLGDKVSRSGVAVGIEGHFTLSRFVFDVRYLQGGLSDTLDIVEGELFVGTHVIPWLRVKLGRHIRSVLVDDVTERWSMWELRLRSEGEVYAPASQAFGLHTYAELWTALTGSIRVAGGFGAARGIEGGIYLRVADSPLTGRLGYRVDRASISGGPRLENTQTLTISIGVGR